MWPCLDHCSFNFQLDVVALTLGHISSWSLQISQHVAHTGPCIKNAGGQMCHLHKWIKKDIVYSSGEAQGRIYPWYSELQWVHMWHVYLEIYLHFRPSQKNLLLATFPTFQPWVIFHGNFFQMLTYSLVAKHVGHNISRGLLWETASVLVSLL